MSHFRTKPVVVEAHQWYGTISSYDALNHWAGQEQTDKIHDVWRDRVEQGRGEEYFTKLVVHGPDCDLKASSGDWIVRHATGDLAVYNADYFATHYEPLPAAARDQETSDG